MSEVTLVKEKTIKVYVSMKSCNLFYIKHLIYANAIIKTT